MGGARVSWLKPEAPGTAPPLVPLLHSDVACDGGLRSDVSLLFQSLSRVLLLVTPRTVARCKSSSLSMISQAKYCGE